jgi:hypothetical protein
VDGFGRQIGCLLNGLFWAVAVLIVTVAVLVALLVTGGS